MIEYIELLIAKHRATREAWIEEGKTYRSRFVAYENGYIQALHDILAAIEEPANAERLRQAVGVVAQRITEANQGK